MGVGEITLLGIFGFTMMSKTIILHKWMYDIKQKNKN